MVTKMDSDWHTFDVLRELEVRQLEREGLAYDRYELRRIDQPDTAVILSAFQWARVRETDWLPEGLG